MAEERYVFTHKELVEKLVKARVYTRESGDSMSSSVLPG